MNLGDFCTMLQLEWLEHRGNQIWLQSQGIGDPWGKAPNQGSLWVNKLLTLYRLTVVKTRDLTRIK